MNDHLARIRSVTENYDLLQGLRSLPMGGLSLLALLFEVTALGPFRAVPGAIAYVLLGGATLLVGARHHWLLTEAFGAIPKEEESHVQSNHYEST